MKTPDASLLLYAVNADSEQHHAARDWLEASFAAAGGVAFCWPVLVGFLLARGRGGNLVGDAHVAALAIEHDAELGTFDRDFEHFAGLRMALLA